MNKSIAFIANSKSFLPDIYAYSDFFINHGWRVKRFRHVPNLIELESFNIEWHFMGTDFLSKVPGRIKIHEYCSVSTPLLAKFKNRIKKCITVNPDYRIFQSMWVANEMKMYNKPYILRDMGIRESFFISNEITTKKKEYDFVYSGSFDKQRNIEKLVDSFLTNFIKEKLLLIGNIPSWLTKLHSDQLVLVNSIPYEEVGSWLQKAEYGIDYRPNIYPHNYQTSTKLLEYCAAGLKIITTSYEWVNQFEKQNGGHFFRLKENGSNFYPELINEFQFVTPDVRSRTWDIQFSSSEFKKLLGWLNSNSI